MTMVLVSVFFSPLEFKFHSGPNRNLPGRMYEHKMNMQYRVNPLLFWDIVAV